MILRWLFGCRHRQQARPVRERQRCLACGAWREYVIGQPPGRWQPPEPPAIWMIREDLQEQMLQIRNRSTVIVMPRRKQT